MVSRWCIPRDTLFRKHWRYFLHATEIPSCSTRGLCLKDKSKQRQLQAGWCDLPQCNADFQCPNKRVQPLICITALSCRNNLWSLNPLNVILFSFLCLWAFKSAPTTQSGVAVNGTRKFVQLWDIKTKKALNYAPSPLTYRRITFLKIKYDYSIMKNEFLQQILTEITGHAWKPRNWESEESWSLTGITPTCVSYLNRNAQKKEIILKIILILHLKWHCCNWITSILPL